MQTKTFSPKVLADVLGVSESSIKRWADAGLIATSRTAGGHRRIRLHDALQFIRRQEMDVLRPDLLGLPDLETLPSNARDGALSEEALYTLLHSEEAARARGLITAAFLGGIDLGALFDGPVAGALHRLGELWCQDERGIYLEHVATSICAEAVAQVRALLPPPPDGAPVALGGAPSGDPYLIPTLMAATVLTDTGYTTINLGPETPISAFHHAAEDHAPTLVWLSVTTQLDTETRTALVDKLIVPLQTQNVDVVVGGQDTEAHPDAWPDTVRVLASMGELAVFVDRHRNGEREA